MSASRSWGAALLVAAGIGTAVLTPSVASAAVVHHEFEYEANAFNLVLAATKSTVSDPQSGTEVRLATDNNDARGQWKQETVPGEVFSSYVLRSTETQTGGRRLCLDLRGNSIADGTDVVVRPCDGTISQKWRVRFDIGTGAHPLESQFARKFAGLDPALPAGSGAFTVNVKIFPGLFTNDGRPQHWTARTTTV